MSGEFLVESAMKAQQWERTKGELRAIAAMQGSYSSGGQDDAPEYKRWTELSIMVETFIENVEADGLHE